MINFLQRLWDLSAVQRWRRRAVRDTTPRCTVELCRILLRQGRITAAREAARSGLVRFPHSVELKELLHATWKRSGQRRIRELESKLAKEPTPDNHEALVSYYLEFNEIERAAEAARHFLRAYPEDARSALVQGRVLLARFHRDHVARDGAEGLRHLLRAAELSPGSFEANYALAETYYYIGAVSKALFHLYRAIDAEPENADAARLFKILSKLPLEKEEENDLLREVEERDEACFRHRSDAPARSGPSLPPDLLVRLEQVSLMAGVRRVAFCHEGQGFIAEGGVRRSVDSERPDAFVELASGFRKTASLSAKRMGIGAFEEAELRWDGGCILAAGAGPAIVLVDSEAGPRVSAIAGEVRDLIAGCAPAGVEGEGR